MVEKRKQLIQRFQRAVRNFQYFPLNHRSEGDEMTDFGRMNDLRTTLKTKRLSARKILALEEDAIERGQKSGKAIELFKLRNIRKRRARRRTATS